MRLFGANPKRGRRTKPILIILACVGPFLAGSSCESGDRANQIRTNVAPAVSDLFTALGTLVGDTVAAAITPLPDETDPDPVPVQ